MKVKYSLLVIASLIMLSNCDAKAKVSNSESVKSEQTNPTVVDVAINDDIPTVDQSQFEKEKEAVLPKVKSNPIVEVKEEEEKSIQNLKDPEIEEKLEQEPTEILKDYKIQENILDHKEETGQSEDTDMAEIEQNISEVADESSNSESLKEVSAIENNKDSPVLESTIDHTIWHGLLSKYVSATGVVNYAGFKKDRAKHQMYLDLLAKEVPGQSWSEAESLAYWINAYNAFTVDLIVSNYPTSSIMNIDGGKPWDSKRILLAGKKYSLNQIEHEIIRPIYKDARIHFAVNCAAKSCPKLGNKAFTADNLESLLEGLTREFVNNTVANRISSGSASLSKIFEWYASDFGNLISFINQYSNTKLSSNASISYLDYNWELNGN